MECCWLGLKEKVTSGGFGGLESIGEPCMVTVEGRVEILALVPKDESGHEEDHIVLLIGNFPESNSGSHRVLDNLDLECDMSHS